MSAMEHIVPEQMFSTETNKAQGISAVKAIGLAGQEGQKIWTIDDTNLEFALNKINLGADTETDIRNAVNAGKVVTTHTAKINFNGWIGEGYIMIDPKTGAGAYMIAGGGNGGAVFGLIATVLGFMESFTDVMKEVVSGNNQQAFAFRELMKGFGAVLKKIAPSLGLVAGILESLGNCPNVSSAIINVVGVSIIAFAGLGVAAMVASVATAGLGMFIFINVVVPMLVNELLTRLLSNIPAVEGCTIND